MMTRKLPLIIILPLFVSFAQKTPSLYFSAGDIYRTAQTVGGDSALWPLFTSLAQRDVDRNGFLLTSASLHQIKAFSKIHAEMKKGRSSLQHLLKAGARVFAPDLLNTATTLSTHYNLAIKEGDIVHATTLASQFLATIDSIAKEIEEKRTEDIDALIAQRNGDVTKRRGLLGQWIAAAKGDLLRESDGVKTGDASFAHLAFTDGCDVMVEPNSTVLIRKSTMDKLDRSIRREIALVRGGLLTTLTASAKERNKLRLEAGTMQSEVQSGKFWTSTIGERRVKLSNYDGSIKVSANKSEVHVAANEGTVVEKGKPPMPPVPLLAAPYLLWKRSDSTVYDSELLLAWTPIPHAKEYKVELSPTKEFTSAIKSFSTKTTTFTLVNIQRGMLYIRLYAVDSLGLRGIESPVYKLVRVEDHSPPPIYLNGWNSEKKYTILPSITISGTTEPGARLTADGVPQTVNAQGEFSFNVSLGKAERQITLKATDKAGNSYEQILSVVPIDSNKVKHVEWNCPADEFAIYPTTDEITGRGVSYPSIKITATLGKQITSVQTDSQGNWAVSLRKGTDDLLTLVFESISDNTVIATQTLRVKQ